MDLRPLINFIGRTHVTFINATTGKLIGVQKMKADQLPVSFNKPILIEFNGLEWRVMKAVPVHAKEFTLENKLILHVENPKTISQPLGYNFPSICLEFPESSLTEPLYNDFYLDISKERWRQFEFFPPSLLPVVQEELEKIMDILYPSSNANTLHGYFDLHIRKNIRQEPLNIPFDSFCEKINAKDKGGIRNASNGYIRNGFAIRTENHTYYGTLKDSLIEELNLESFESVDEEFFVLASYYELVLADWCNAKLIMT
jgi:hypothetical protein